MHVIPAKAGIQPLVHQAAVSRKSWIPAFAGMTSVAHSLIVESFKSSTATAP
jgi:hypothetical protein